MKKFAILLLFALCLNANSISKNEKQLQLKKQEQEQLSKKIEDLANEIIQGEKKLEQINSQVNLASKKTKELQELVNAQNNELDIIILQNKELVNEQNKLENKLIDIISKDYAYDLISPDDFIESADSIVNKEILLNLSLVLKDEYKLLASEYIKTSQKIDYKQRRINEINNNIKDYKNKEKELNKLKNEQEKLVAKQKLDERIYKERLSNLQKQQDELRATLQKLKIIEENKQKQNVANKSINVKHSTTLNTDTKVIKYSGAKTISPLQSYSLKQKFGEYEDPIYKLKIFNENVILRSNDINANVRVVLDGKVVFANDTAVLDKVVIIEHANKLHTIYAHLDKFSPLAKVGSVVKKGNIIGKVKQDLTFEVTQKNFHINPMDLIK